MSAYMDTPHYRVNKFVSTLRVLGMTRSPIATCSGIPLTVDDLEAVIVASAPLFDVEHRVERMQEGGPWTLVERETGSTDKLWKCDECGMNVWCGRVPGPWSHMETCRHAVAAEQVRVMREALENIAGTNGSECAAPRPVAGDALKRAGKITRERNLPEPASPSNVLGLDPDGRGAGKRRLHGRPLDENGAIEFAGSAPVGARQPDVLATAKRLRGLVQIALNAFERNDAIDWDELATALSDTLWLLDVETPKMEIHGSTTERAYGLQAINARRYRFIREHPQFVIYRPEDREQATYALSKLAQLDGDIDKALAVGVSGVL